MSSDTVEVPVPAHLLGNVYALMAFAEMGGDRLRLFVDKMEYRHPQPAAADAEDEPDNGVTLGEDEPDEEPIDPLPELLHIATDGQPDRLWAAMDTLGSQDREKLQVLFGMLCEGTRTMTDLDVIDGDYGNITWKRVKRLAAACSKKSVRTPVRHSTKQGTTYVFFTGLRNGLDA